MTMSENIRTLLSAVAAVFCLFSGSASAEPLVFPDPALNRGKPVTATGRESQQILDRKNGEVLGVIAPNPWALKSGTGSSSMSYDGDGTITAIVQYKGLNVYGVNGYPFIGYGADAWGYQNGGERGGVPKLPTRLDSLESLVVDTEYALSGPKYADNLDVAFDIWLIPHVGFKGGKEGAVEVMLMYYYQFKWQNPCKVRKTVQVPATVDDKPTQLSFEQLVCVKGNGPGSYVAYTPRARDNMEKARIRLDMKPLLDDAAKVTGIGMSWYLSGIQFGTEYGNPGSTPDVDYKMTIRHFSIEQTLKLR